MKKVEKAVHDFRGLGSFSGAVVGDRVVLEPVRPDLVATHPAPDLRLPFRLELGVETTAARAVESLVQAAHGLGQRVLA